MSGSAITPDQFSTFGELLKFLRRREALTQRELSIAVGYSDTQISRIEKDMRVPDAATLRALFVPALHLEHEPEWVARLLELAGSAHQGDLPEAVFTPSPGNLPDFLTTFIGRVKEQEEIIQLIGRHRLVTLLGSGGVGKTRLSLKVGERVMGDFRDGVWLAELAPLADPELLAQTLASALEIATQSIILKTDLLINFLHARKILLVLDNCEHLLDSCAQLADSLLKHCPDLKILATSRQALGIPGETQYPVPSLGLPAARETLHRIREHESVILFEQRARLARADFSLSEGNALSIAQICSRLDGLPLAIELAAARVNMFSTQEIAARLDGSFNLLTGGSRTALPRHQTIRASIDWSWDLISEAERTLMRRLAVFAGGWSLESAEAVCGEDGGGAAGVLESMSQLVAKSLVIVERTAGRETRYTCHEMIRQYARAKLAEAGDEEKVRKRHLEYFLQLAGTATSALHGPQQAQWFDRLIKERDNFRAALEFASRIDLESGLYLSGRLVWFWEYSDMREGLRWTTEFLEKPESSAYPHARAIALLGQGNIFWHFQQFEAARSVFEECLALFRATGDQQGEIDTLNSMGGVMQFLKGMNESREFRNKALELAESIGDIWRQAMILETMGWDQQDPLQGRAHWEVSIGLFRQLGDWRGLEWALAILSFTVLSNGDMAWGQKYLDEALEVHQRTNDRRGMEFILTGQSLIALMRGEYGQARALLQENIDILEEIGNRMGTLWGRARLGYVALRAGNLSEAYHTLARVIEDFHADRNKSGLAFSLDKMAGLHAAMDQFVNAATLIGWSDVTRKEIGDPRPLLEQSDVDGDVKTIIAAIGSSGFETAYASGGEMTVDQAVALALDITI